MDVTQAIHSRRAVREFTTQSVDKAMLGRLIDAAVQAPSAVNEQPWSFTVVQDKAVLSRISNEAKAYILRTPPKAMGSPHLQQILNDPKFDIFYAAPALIVISSLTPGQWAVEDCSLAAENLMLAACAEGLGTCWIGFAQTWLGTADGKATLGLAPKCLPVAPIIVGHPKSATPPVERRQPQVRWIGP
jgi:nitroreductase